MNDQDRFAKLAAQSRGLVGGIGKDFNETLQLLAETKNVEYEFSRKGDTIARAYWHDVDVDGELFGGCVSIIANDVSY
jgi:hypothetical protein